MTTPGHLTLESMSQALWYNRWTMRKFAHYLCGKILEVGCGIGNFTPALARFGQVWSIDIDQMGLKRTEELISKKIRVGWGDIEKGKYFFRRKHFNTIVCLNVLEHIGNDRQALKNMHQLLAPGGYLILLVPIYPFLYGSIDRAIGHYRRYDPRRISALLKSSHFQILSARRLNFLGALGWWLSGKLFKRPTVSQRRIKLFNRLAPWVLPLEDLVEPPVGTSLLVVAQKGPTRLAQALYGKAALGEKRQT